MEYGRRDLPTSIACGVLEIWYSFQWWKTVEFKGLKKIFVDSNANKYMQKANRCSVLLPLQKLVDPGSSLRTSLSY
jgi:hypothetical protein